MKMIFKEISNWNFNWRHNVLEHVKALCVPHLFRIILTRVSVEMKNFSRNSINRRLVVKSFKWPPIPEMSQPNPHTCPELFRLSISRYRWPQCREPFLRNIALTQQIAVPASPSVGFTRSAGRVKLERVVNWARKRAPVREYRFSRVGPPSGTLEIGTKTKEEKNLPLVPPKRDRGVEQDGHPVDLTSHPTAHTHTRLHTGGVSSEPTPLRTFASHRKWKWAEVKKRRGFFLLCLRWAEGVKKPNSWPATDRKIEKKVQAETKSPPTWNQGDSVCLSICFWNTKKKPATGQGKTFGFPKWPHAVWERNKSNVICSIHFWLGASSPNIPSLQACTEKKMLKTE